MKPDEIARRLIAIRHRELDCAPLDSCIQAPSDTAVVTLDPPSAALPYPSANRNGVFFFGCRAACSETLARLKTSLGNLQRNGFEIAYYKKVYVWGS